MCRLCYIFMERKRLQRKEKEHFRPYSKIHAFCTNSMKITNFFRILSLLYTYIFVVIICCQVSLITHHVLHLLKRIGLFENVQIIFLTYSLIYLSCSLIYLACSLIYLKSSVNNLVSSLIYFSSSLIYLTSSLFSYSLH